MTADQRRTWALVELDEAGYLRWWSGGVVSGAGWLGRLSLVGVVALRKDERFVEGPLSGMHPEVGEPRTEFRSVRGSLGPGSLQVVVNLQTGVCFLDVDRFSPYDDVVGFVGHTGEVLSGWGKRVWRWLKR